MNFLCRIALSLNFSAPYFLVKMVSSYTNCGATNIPIILSAAKFIYLA